jgi:molybdate transport system regulatory protein
METVGLTLRVDFGSDRLLGPEKIRLLEAIAKTGSISQAGRALGMSYRKAWCLVDAMNSCFCDPVIEARTGGSNGGCATLTELGHNLVGRYRAIEDDALAATREHLYSLEANLKGTRADRRQRPLERSARVSIKRW